MFRGRVRHVHFVGIGGIGMSGIAEVLLSLGYQVSGSDLRAGEATRRLEGLGARTYAGHRAEHIDGADVVVYTSAAARENPELVYARALGVPVIPRAEMLAELMRLKYGIAIAGSHGKTTTTSLVATVLQAAGLDPTVVIGGKLNAIGTNARAGTGDLLVAEADESDGSFLKLTPTIAVVTNIDPEHLDHHGSHEQLKTAFVEFAQRIPFYGLAVMCLDHPHVQAILPRIDRRHVTYGTHPQADYVALGQSFQGTTTAFHVRRRHEDLGRFEVRVPGRHNVLNCLATIAVAEELDVPTDATRAALASFAGVQRRFTIVGEAQGITLVDDYGHHPAEIEATLSAAKSGFGRRVVAAFQPHRYTRTRDLFEEFTRCFNQADVLVLTEVYPAGESPIPGATGERLAQALREHGHRNVHYEPDKHRVCDRLEALSRPGDMVIALGAGDINQCLRQLYQRLLAGNSPPTDPLV
ncbi:MAG: UDP-N-acetylmuramate--L-alanine ligase [Deltaproteobacteria bacterium]|nr:UDP-N-acetylmuramate--L-alanine ligase [Deltaproteobacteria bacterium]